MSKRIAKVRVGSRTRAAITWLTAGCVFACSVATAASAADSGDNAPTSSAQTTAKRWSRIAHEARSSGDLRLRILFASAIADEPSSVDVVPLNALIDDARGSTDPLVLQLLLSRCRTQPVSGDERCDAVDLATRWTQADAENSMAWVELAAALDAAGDHADADAAFERAGRASTFRDPTTPITRIVLAAAPASTDGRRRYDDLIAAIGIAAAVPVPWFDDVRKACRTDTRRAACGRIADVAFRDADTFIALMAARQLTAQAGEPSWVHRERQRREEALQWAASRADLDAGLDDVGATVPVDLATAVALLDERIRRGEVAVARDGLQALHVSELEGSRRYQDDMAALMARLKRAN